MAAWVRPAQLLVGWAKSSPREKQNIISCGIPLFLGRPEVMQRAVPWYKSIAVRGAGRQGGKYCPQNHSFLLPISPGAFWFSSSARPRALSLHTVGQQHWDQHVRVPKVSESDMGRKNNWGRKQRLRPHRAAMDDWDPKQGTKLQ